MKAWGWLCTLFLASITCSAQTSTIKLYGFKQAIAGGVPSLPQPDEQGNTLEPKMKARGNFFIYLVYPSDLIIYPLEAWLNGDQYSVKPEPVSTPVEIIYDNGVYEPDRVTLVPLTTDSSIHLILSEKIPFKNTGIKKSLAETNELVIVYKMNGKLFSQTLKKIKTLRVGLMQ